MSRLLVATIGSAGDPRAQNGTPAHLLAAVAAHGVLAEGLELRAQSAVMTARRIGWNLAMVARGGGRGGYQFTDGFRRWLWEPAAGRLRGEHVLNCVQLFPSTLVRDDGIRRSYFIDQTLSQLFDTYGVGPAIRADVVADALRREAEGYRTAHAIVVHSSWARRGVLAVEGVDPYRVHVVVPGANLPPYSLRLLAEMRRPVPRVAEDPLRLVFVGRHPHRKGLDRLLAALRIVRAAGADVRLDIVGTRPDELPSDLRDVEGVTWHGLVDKVRDAGRFLTIVGSAHVGCLLSRAEAGGIGLREYHALGLAVLGPDVGGSPDHVLAGAAVLVRPDIGEEGIAELLLDLASDRDRVDAMRAESWRRRDEVSWDRAAAALAQILR